MQGKGQASICAECEKSCGLCTWSSKLKPVKGWTATKVKRRNHDGQMLTGYCVIACPLFEPTERDAEICKPWTDEEIDTLRRMMAQRERYKDIAIILNRSYGSVQHQMSKLRKENKHENY